jgi:dipeptidyl aminopeptidase/acylaminoacyl peptidase
VFVIDAHPGAQAKQLTTSPGQDNPPERGHLAWSPDGSQIAYLAGSIDPKLYAYDQFQLTVVPAAGGEPHPVGSSIDRPVTDPRWSADGKSITVLVTDDRSQYPARIDVASGQITRLLPGQVVIEDASLGADDPLTALITTDTTPSEVVAIEHGVARQLTHVNEAWLTGVRLSAMYTVSSSSPSGTSPAINIPPCSAFTAGPKDRTSTSSRSSASCSPPTDTWS